MTKKKHLEQAIELVHDIARDGDVILIDENYAWYHPVINIACKVIQKCQRNLFGNESNWKDTHAVVYFRDGVFSAESPAGIINRPMERIALEDISIYRYTGKELDRKDVRAMRKVADSMIGGRYGHIHLLNILGDQIMGTPFSNRVNLLGTNKESVVCSVGAGIIYNEMIKRNNLPELFSRLNSDAWTPSFVRRFEDHGMGWDVRTLYPACYANTDTHFSGEFERVAELRNGKLVSSSEYQSEAA